MTVKFDKFVSIFLEKYNSEGIDSEKMRKANEYFSIGHHGEMLDDPQDDDGSQDYCWIWLNGALKVGSGRTHNITFGHDVVEKATFKGWYDTGKHLISFVDNRSNSFGAMAGVDDIPSRVYDHLVRRFKTKNIKVF